MTYRVGIVGAGFGERVHLPAYAGHPNFEVVAIASPHSAQRIANERDITAFKDVNAMLAGIDLDVVSIATPPFSHHDDVLAALSAHKHVICEKPFALNVAQAQDMVQTAKTVGTACGVMHEFRYVPQRQALKELVQNGHLAPLRDMEITQLGIFLRAPVKRRGNWWFQKDKGGGIAGALLSHLIDTSTWLAGRPPVHSVGVLRTANARRSDEERSFTSDVDDGAFALLDYGEGLVARLTVDGTSAVDAFTLAVHAENRTAVSSGTSMTRNTLFSIDEQDTAELDCAPLKYAKFEPINDHVPLVMELLDAFSEQIRTGTSAVPTFEEALQTQRVLDSIGFGA